MSKRQENAHIPKYIKDQPWFYKNLTASAEEDSDYLAHHRRSNRPDNDLDIDNNSEPKVGRGIQDEYERVSTTKSLKGPRFDRDSCSNCGILGHHAKDCLEAPRKRRARFSTSETAQVERRKDSGYSWDAKKDRWYGYEGEDNDAVLRKKQDQFQTRLDKSIEADAVDTDEEIELAALGLYKEETTGIVVQDDAQGSKLRASVRLREDRAAYLNDINSETLNYDPKSRLYKTDDLGEIDSESKMFHRHLTGESLELSKLNRFAREQTLKSGIKDEIEDAAKMKHVLVANPTKYELLMKQDQSKPAAAEPNSQKTQSAKKITGTKQSLETKSQLLQKYG
ncbi:LANO_0C05424g1_1 [Lachancea nothofagi CBS 11611]|uniref:Pre-mRNA-splicing factor SLU7 n=1 Tax=Lachancea nothofagi CBS 11611 TaxID=1266666 RepID=A0A1G4J7F5_9SACH|nr:LANO_0C05424g1_1 [Lachancea nothofagi CBS 11611]